MTTNGTGFAGYVGAGDALTDWHGRGVLACRCYRVELPRHLRGEDGTAFGLVFKLAGGRALVGYALGVGMLFRGELVYSHQDADRECVAVCEHWAERDAEDAAAFEYEQEQEHTG